MQDKAGLLKSMDNLTRYVKSSRAAQQQIFNTLQAKDFKKIMANFADPLPELRLKSAYLLSHLLYDSETLQRKFCESLNIHYSYQSQVILNHNLNEIMRLFPQKAKQIFTLLKSHHRMRSSNNKNLASLLWFINPQKEMLNIEYLSGEQLQRIIKNINFKDQQQLIFDPLYCIFGTLINSSSSLKYNLQSASTANTLHLDNKQLDYPNKYRETVKIQNYVQIPIKNPNYYTPLILSGNYQNQSHNQNMHTANKYNIYETPITKHSQQSQNTMAKFETPKISQLKFSTPIKNSNLTYSPNEYSKWTNQGSRTQRPTPLTKQPSPSSSFRNYVKQGLATDRTFMINITANNFKLESPATGRAKNEWEDNNWISPSQKIKSIAMNGRQGLEAFKNVKLLTPAYNPSKFEYLA